MTMDEYYHNYYLPKHTMRATRMAHLLGNTVTVVWLIVALTQTSGLTLALMLLATPFIIYPFAWISHRMFEPEGGQTPAALTSNPLKAKASDWRMCYEMVTGKIGWGR